MQIVEWGRWEGCRLLSGMDCHSVALDPAAPHPTCTHPLGEAQDGRDAALRLCCASSPAPTRHRGRALPGTCMQPGWSCPDGDSGHSQWPLPPLQGWLPCLAAHRMRQVPTKVVSWISGRRPFSPGRSRAARATTAPRVMLACAYSAALTGGLGSSKPLLQDQGASRVQQGKKLHDRRLRTA